MEETNVFAGLFPVLRIGNRNPPGFSGFLPNIRGSAGYFTGLPYHESLRDSNPEWGCAGDNS